MKMTEKKPFKTPDKQNRKVVATHTEEGNYSDSSSK